MNSKIHTGHIVYVLESMGYSKIGITNDINKRLQSIRTSLPEEVHHVYELHTGSNRANAFAIEKQTHTLLKNHRAHGEWFSVSADDVKDICKVNNICFTTPCRIPTTEAIDAMKDLSSGAFKLLIYYYSKSTGWEFKDKEIADALGVTEKRVGELRKGLVDKDYLLIEKGGYIDNYFIGRQAVRKWKDPDTELDEDNNE